MSKSKTISMQLTEAENEIIKKKANHAGTSLSRFMVNAAIADNELTATTKQQFYYRKAIIQDYAKQIASRYNDVIAKQLYQEVEYLWQLLK